jgi:hypothetical protein
MYFCMYYFFVQFEQDLKSKDSWRAFSIIRRLKHRAFHRLESRSGNALYAIEVQRDRVLGCCLQDS